MFSCTGPLDRVKEAAPDTYTRAIMIGDDLDHDTANSVFMSADNQVRNMRRRPRLNNILNLPRCCPKSLTNLKFYQNTVCEFI